MISTHYQIQNSQKLAQYLKAYILLVETIAKSMKINLSEKRFTPDHLGLQVLDSDEFDNVTKTLLTYSKIVKKGIIHNRRNTTFKFNMPIEVDSTKIEYIEIFEPKPDADLKKLKPGIEHIAYVVNDYDTFYNECLVNNVLIDKAVDFEDSKFFKTSFVNLVEIEFRTEHLADLKD